CRRPPLFFPFSASALGESRYRRRADRPAATAAQMARGRAAPVFADRRRDVVGDRLLRRATARPAAASYGDSVDAPPPSAPLLPLPRLRLHDDRGAAAAAFCAVARVSCVLARRGALFPLAVLRHRQPADQP